MKTWTFTLPFLPPSLNVYRGDHWTDQISATEATP
jgi:hypothetical protein